MDKNSVVRVLVCALLASCISVSGQSSSGRTIRHRREAVTDSSQPPELEQAEAAIEKKDYAAAEPLLQKVVTAQPANYQDWFDLGFVQSSLGKDDEAVASYRQSVAAKPDVFESNLNLGLLLAKSGEVDAEQYLRAATTLRPQTQVDEGHARAWLGLARFLEDKDPAEALEAYRRAAALRPTDPEPRLAAGLLLEKENRFGDAEEQYTQALTLDPGSQDALVGLANIYMKGRRFGEAEEYLRKVISQRPNEAAPHVQLGRVLAADQKYDDAISELQTGLKIAPQDFSVQRDLAELYSTLGKNDQAEAAYRVLVASHPNEADLHRGLGQSLLRQKKYAAAQQEFLTTVKLKPDLGEAYGDLAFAASENKDYMLTLKALDARSKLLPDAPLTHFLRASAYDHLKDFKHAAESYHLFLDTAKGKYPDQEWQAKHRLIAIQPKK